MLAPSKLTPPKLLDISNAKRLAYLASLVAIEASITNDIRSPHVRITWATVQSIRDALDDAEYDWRTPAKQRKHLAGRNKSSSKTTGRQNYEAALEEKWKGK